LLIEKIISGWSFYLQGKPHSQTEKQAFDFTYTAEFTLRL